MSHPINDEILDGYREELDRLREEREDFLEVANELWAAYWDKNQESPIKWLNGKFAALKFTLEKLKGAPL